MKKESNSFPRKGQKKILFRGKAEEKNFFDLSKEKNLILFSQITKNQILLKFLVKDCLSSFTEIFFSNYFFPKNFISYNDSLLHKEFHIIKWFFVDFCFYFIKNFISYNDSLLHKEFHIIKWFFVDFCFYFIKNFIS